MSADSVGLCVTAFRRDKFYRINLQLDAEVRRRGVATGHKRVPLLGTNYMLACSTSRQHTSGCHLVTTRSMEESSTFGTRLDTLYGFFQHRQLCPAVRLLTSDAANTVRASISCRLDYCNSLLYNVSRGFIGKTSHTRASRNCGSREVTAAASRVLPAG